MNTPTRSLSILSLPEMVIRVSGVRIKMMISTLLIAIACVYVVYGHVTMSQKLADLKESFAASAHADVQRAQYDLDADVTTLDYDGALDAIIAERNALLKDNGCAGIGSWRVRKVSAWEYDVNFGMVYICLP